MQRFSVATWTLATTLAAGLLPGCAEVIAEQGGASAEPRGIAAPVRADTRADRRAYYAYTRSVWAEIQGDLDAAVQWGREAVRFDSSSRVVRNHLASVLLKKAAKVEQGSGVPNKNRIGRVTKKQVEEIAKLKMVDLNAADLAAAVKTVEGTARSMGIEVVG